MTDTHPRDTELAPDLADAAMEEAAIGRRQRKPLGVMFWAAVTFLSLLLFAAVFADVLPLKDPAFAFRGTNKNGPSLDYFLGNDSNGRDIFSRVIYGAQVSLLISAIGTTLALTLGGLVGLAGGYYRGRVDQYTSAFLNATLVIPGLILFIALILFLDPEANYRIFVLIFSFVLLSIAPISRVVRAATLSWAERDFVLAARTIGARSGRVMFREVLPNVAPSLISYSLIIMAQLIVVEGAVAFLGLSVPPPTPTWGDMINKGRNDLEGAAHISLMPAMVMFLTVVSLNFVGDKLQERFDTRESIL